MKNLEGILFPELACLHEGRLKYLLLLYDRLYFLPNDTSLNPGHDTIVSRFSIYDIMLAAGFRSVEESRRAVMYASDQSGWDDPMRRLMDAYAQLEEEGFCIALREADFSSAWAPHPLEAAVDSDMRDLSFQRICVGALRRKLPELKDTAGMKGGGFSTRPPRWQGAAFFSSICSERLNTALYLAARQGFVPVTTDAVFMNLLGLKLQRANAEVLKGQAIGGVEQRRSSNYGMLSWRLATEVVSIEALACRSIEDVLRYRAASREHELRFREYLSRLAHREEEAFLREEAAGVADRLVQTEILPLVEQLRAEKARIWNKLFHDAVSAVGRPQVLVPLLAAHLIPSVSYSMLIPISSSMALALGAFLPKLLEAKRADDERRRNAMFFLIAGP